MSVDYLLKGGVVIDGTGTYSSMKNADIAIEGPLIKDIGSLSHISAQKTINVDGMCISPGFIDVHAHSEFLLLADGRAEGKICQGITTEVNGNCGLSAAPLSGAAMEQRERDLIELDISERWSSFSEFFGLLKAKGIAINFTTLVGHGNLRASTVGYTDIPVSREDREKMNELLRVSMKSGAKGLSTGLIYPPGIYSDTQEIIDLAIEAKMCEGLYATHMRNEGDELLEAIDEVLEIAMKSGIHAHISHLKTSGERNWKKLQNVFEKIDQANNKACSVTCDRYPYIASSTDLDAILPAWAFEGGRKSEIRRLKGERRKLRRDVLRAIPSESFWDNVVVSSVILNKNKWMEGKNITEIGNELKKEPLETVFDILVEEELQVGAIYFLMNEENLHSILKFSNTMIGTDSSARSFDGKTAIGIPHPRGFGSFPRILGRYVRELKVLTLEEAIYKMTCLPARVFRIHQRGVIATGYFADLVVFDPETVIDNADYKNPFSKPEGIHYVFVNGQPVVFDQETTGKLPGMILK